MVVTCVAPFWKGFQKTPWCCVLSAGPPWCERIYGPPLPPGTQAAKGIFAKYCFIWNNEKNKKTTTQNSSYCNMLVKSWTMNLLLMAHTLVHAVSFFQNGEETTSGYERLLNAVTLKRSSCREENVPPLRDFLICSLCFFFFKANIKVRCYKSTSAVTLR